MALSFLRNKNEFQQIYLTHILDLQKLLSLHVRMNMGLSKPLILKGTGMFFKALKFHFF